MPENTAAKKDSNDLFLSLRKKKNPKLQTIYNLISASLNLSTRAKSRF